MINFFKKSISSIPSTHYNKIYLILFLSLLSVFIELIGIGMIIPILSIFVDNDHLKYTKFFFAEEISKNQIFISILIGFLFIYFCKFFLLRYLIYKHNELAQVMKTDLSKKMFENYLYKNYLFHIKNNSSNLIPLTSVSNLRFSVLLHSRRIDLFLNQFLNYRLPNPSQSKFLQFFPLWN